MKFINWLSQRLATNLKNKPITGELLADNAPSRRIDNMIINLRGANFQGADLRGADFRDADLTGADLTGADCKGADFRDANLTDTIFAGTDLRDIKANHEQWINICKWA